MPISPKDALFLVNIDAQIKVIRVNGDHDVLDCAIITSVFVLIRKGRIRVCSQKFQISLCDARILILRHDFEKTSVTRVRQSLYLQAYMCIRDAFALPRES